MGDATETEAGQVAADWNRNAEQWAGDLQSGRDRIRDLFTFPAFQECLPNVEGLKLIDFGCGEGTNTRRLAELGAKMTGIDLAEQMIAHALAAEAGRPLGVEYAVGSYTGELPFADGSFDGVVSTMAFMDGPDFAGAMRAAVRLVRPGGFVAFSVLHPCFTGRRWRWAKDQAGNTAGLVVSRYFERAGYTDHWSFRPETAAPAFAVPRFPRTMGDYLNGVAGAGLRIVRVEEPQPSPTACKELPSLARWGEHAALQLVVVAERPA